MTIPCHRSIPSRATRAHRAALISVSNSPQPDTSWSCKSADSHGGQCVCLALSLRRYQFILLGQQRHMYVNNLFRVDTWSGATGTRTCDLWLQVRRPNHYATTPHRRHRPTPKTRNSLIPDLICEVNFLCVGPKYRINNCNMNMCPDSPRDFGAI